MMNRETNQQKLKVQPLKKLMRNLKEETRSFLNIYIHEINEDEKIHDNIGGDDVNSVE